MEKKITKLHEFLGVPKGKLEELGVFDSFIGIDAKLFIDPTLLELSEVPEFANSRDKLMRHYSRIIKLLRNSKTKGDLAWREARKLLMFKELGGLSIGYSNKSDTGNAIGPKLRDKLLERAKEIIDLGIGDPEIFELIGLIEEGFGPDRLSDMVGRILADDIYVYSARVHDDLATESTLPRILVKKTDGTVYSLIKHPYKNKPLLCLPENILRDLPIATSWEDIQELGSFNERLRKKINELIGLVWKQESKVDIASLVLSDPQNISDLVATYRTSDTKPYDYKLDRASQLMWYELGQEFANKYPLNIVNKSPKNMSDLEEIVAATVQQFRRNIEHNGLNEHLYLDITGEKLRNERYAQLLFYSVADTYCKANKLDVSREPNAGSGPVDFKISQNYNTKVVVELKLSTHKKLIQSVEEQIQAYMDAENTNSGIIVIIQVRNNSERLDNLREYYRKLQEMGKRLPQLIFIDGRIKPSASRRYIKSKNTNDPTGLFRRQARVIS